uniref:Glycosyl transferase CAP10 domain-containing protein n=1 Tax=Lutzomyia longipalpis TaxID=7200 RepID=A0A1B0CTJ2_LUTLO
MNLIILAVIVLRTLLVSPVSSLDIDLGKSVIWGPGLGETTLPVRYFFVQLVNNAGENVTESQDIKLDIQLVGQPKNQRNAENCRYSLEQFDAGDGSIVVRYRIPQECRGVSIHVMYKGQHLGDSPYSIPSPIFPEICSCPLEIDEFRNVYKCPERHPQIEEDMSTFSGINYTHVQEKMLEKFSTDNPGSLAICQYVVLSGELFRRCFGKHVGFTMFMDATLLSILRKVKLPDFEIFVNLGDWPVSRKGGRSRTQGPWPVFSWCGSSDSFDIVMPTYDITESTLEAMNRVSLDIISVQKSATKWADKIPKAFFRGRDANRERLKSVELSRRNPELLDSAITNFFFFRDEEDTYGPKSPRVSFFDFFKYKFQINIDGTVAGYRFPYLLAGNSVVLKQDSPYYEHFYSQLKPMVHYIPFRRNLSDLIEKIHWAKSHDTTVRKIAQNARAFVRENLLPTHIFCYHVLLFEQWHQLTRLHKVSVASDMEKVPKPEESSSCSCDRKVQRDEL